MLVQQPALFGVLFQLFRGHLVSVYAVLKFFASVPKGLVLGHWVRRQGFDVLHAHFLTTPATVALIASKVSGVPYTVTIHAFDIYTTDAKSVNGAVRAKCEHAAANVIISKFGQTYITERWPGLDARFELIYNGIDLSLFTPEERAPIDPSVSPVRILSNGRLIEKKGHDYSD